MRKKAVIHDQSELLTLLYSDEAILRPIRKRFRVYYLTFTSLGVDAVYTPTGKPKERAPYPIA